MQGLISLSLWVPDCHAAWMDMYRAKHLAEPQIFPRSRNNATIKVPKRWGFRTCQVALDMAPGSKVREETTSLVVVAAKVMEIILECIEPATGFGGGIFVGKEYTMVVTVRGLPGKTQGRWWGLD